VGNDGGHPRSGSRAPTPFLQRAGLYLAIAFELPGTIAGGILLGYLLDEYFDSSPWLLIAFSFIAFVGATLRLVQWARFFAKGRNDQKLPRDPAAH
jgi:F0F1-type ATP synthase assembly protein I